MSVIVPPKTLRMWQLSMGSWSNNMTLSFQYFVWAAGSGANTVRRCYFPDQTRNTIVTGVVYGLDNDSFNVTRVQLRLRRNGIIVETYDHDFSARERNYYINFANEHVFEPGDYADLEVRRNNSGADGNDSTARLIYYQDIPQ